MQDSGDDTQVQSILEEEEGRIQTAESPELRLENVEIDCL